MRSDDNGWHSLSYDVLELLWADIRIPVPCALLGRKRGVDCVASWGGDWLFLSSFWELRLSLDKMLFVTVAICSHTLPENA
jgi:hypothetical protein